MDPSKPLPAPGNSSPQDPAPTLEGLLSSQLRLAQSLQTRLNNQEAEGTLSPRDYRDFASAATGIISLAHRTEEALKVIKTYSTFFEVVLEFVRSRSDSLGEDLVAKLMETSRELRSEQEASSVIGRL